jgi:hypothetical protein
MKTIIPFRPSCGTVYKSSRLLMAGLLVISSLFVLILHFNGPVNAQEGALTPIGPTELTMGVPLIINVSNADVEIHIEARYPGAKMTWIFEQSSLKSGVRSFELPPAYAGSNITYRTLIRDGSDPEGLWMPGSYWVRTDLSGWVDEDGDGLSDLWESIHKLDTDDPNEDEDNDNLIILEEMYHLTDPKKRDSDGDSMDDEWEVSHGTLPFRDDPNADPDGDSWSNIMERSRGTEPRDPSDHPEDLPVTPWYWIVIITAVLLLIIGYFVKQLFNKRRFEDDMDDFDRDTSSRSTQPGRDISGKI